MYFCTSASLTTCLEIEASIYKKQISVNWSIFSQASSIKANRNSCNLCLEEKLQRLLYCNSMCSLNIMNFTRNACMRTDCMWDDSHGTNMRQQTNCELNNVTT